MARATDLIDRVSGAAGTAVGHAEALAGRIAPEADRGLIRRAMDLPLRKKVQFARRLWDDPRMGQYARLPVLAGLAYAVLPLRFTPKVLGPVREVERIAGLAALLWLLVRLAPRDVVTEHLEALEQPGRLGRLWRRTAGDQPRA